MSYSVGQVARMAGITVRTLHHYDDVGLLSPSGRTDAGYRRYEHDDLERLQRILFYRELELPLQDIAELLGSDVDPMVHLRRQHELLTSRAERLVDVITALEKTMEARKLGISLSPEEMLEVFGEHDPLVHADEVQERWADSDAYRQSMERTKRYTKDEWKQALDEGGAIATALAAAMHDGEPADSVRAMDLAEAHRQHISRWFYDCSVDVHRGLGEMYVADPRFTATYEQVADGLASYIRDAIVANGERQAG